MRLFSPWSLNADHAAKALLKRHGWQEPHGDTMPTGGDLYDAYLRPLAETPEMRAVIETKTTVKAISRQGIGKVVTRGREDRPFSLLVQNGALARGSWLARSLMRPARGEIKSAGRVRSSRQLAKPMPPISSPTAFRTCWARTARHYAGKRVLVVGGGHSAANVLLDLARLAETDSRMELTWAVRGKI